MTSTAATPQDAYALLAATDTLDRPARMRKVAQTARELAGTPRLAPLLAELAEGGTFERALMLTIARVTGSDTVLLSLLGDPDFGLRVAALNALIVSPAFDAAVLATLDDAPVAWRRAVIRAIRRARRSDLADQLLLAGESDEGDEGYEAHEASQTREAKEVDKKAKTPRLPKDLLVRLLPTCTAPAVTRLLPEYTHLAVDWKRLGTAHPQPVLALITGQLDALPDGPRTTWWATCAAGVAAAAPAEPEQVLALLERHPVWRRVAFPNALAKHLGALAELDAARTLTLLLDAAISSGPQNPHTPLKVTAGPYWAARRARMSRKVRRLLLLQAPDQALRWGRLYADDDQQTATLLKTLPPAHRDAFFDAVTEGRDLEHTLLTDPLLDVLPHQRRHREARRMLTLPALDRDLARKLAVTARLPWDQARGPLLDQTRVADAAARAAAYPLAIACVAAERDPVLFAAFLDEDLTRLRNEQDPVRQPTLKALANTSPTLIGPRAVAALTRLGTDTVEVRDVSVGSLSALRQLARRVLVHHAESGDEALLQWCLSVLEQVEGSAESVDREPLDTLRRGQERAVVAVLTPWVRNGMARAHYRRLLSLAQALGRRAWALPEVQGWLRETIWNSPSGVAAGAIELWLADPAHRDERVEALIGWDPSVAKLWQVADVIGRRRTDLLDPYLTGTAPGGRFMTKDVRWVPSFATTAPDNWLPRQSAEYAKVLSRIAGDSGAAVSTRTDAIGRSARLGHAGRATIEKYLTAGNIQLCEAALGAVVWLPDPAAAIPTLLEYTDGDRARVAIYALTRAAQYARPSELEPGLRAVLASPTSKITSRKETLRVAAQIGVPHLVEVLLETWGSQRQHRHVRMAAVTRLVAHLDDVRVWAALDSATAADRDVALELLRVAPLGIPARHRAGYGKLVADLCTHPEPLVRNTARTQVAAWYPWAPQAADALQAAMLNIASTDPLPIAGVGQLVAAGWPQHRFLHLIRELTTAAAAEQDQNPGGPGNSSDDRALAPTPFRDRPARRRLEDLATNLTSTLRTTLEDWRPTVAATAAFLAAEPGWLSHAARLHTQALDLTAGPEAFTAAIKTLADLTDGRPLTAHAVAETLTAGTAGADPIAPKSFHAAATALAADPRTCAGILAVALCGTAGPGRGWDRQWRTLVTTLRTHPDPDVAESALHLRMGQI